MVKFLVAEFERKHKVDMSGNARALMRLRAACERTKRTLSFSMITEVEIECLHDGIDFEYKFSRAKFDEINMDLFHQCMDTVKTCLKDARMEACEVDEVVLVGGSTRIPVVQLLMQELFTGKELRKSISPDEAVAYGATVLATSLVGAGNQRVKDLTLVDVLPLSLGVAQVGGGMSVVIPRNTPIPVTRSMRPKPVCDNLTKIAFKIYEGERKMAKDNNLLGGFTLEGLPPNRLCEEVSINLTFDVNADGILAVTAQDENSDARNAITVMNREIYSSKDIRRMVAEAELHDFDDEVLWRNRRSKCEFTAFIHNVRFRMSKATDMSITSKRRMEEKLGEASSWLLKNESAWACEVDVKRAKLEDFWNLLKRDGNV